MSDMVPFATCRGHVAIRPDESERTHGGVILPQTVEEEIRHGTVVAVFRPWTDERGRRHVPILRPGDHVVYRADDSHRVETTSGTFDVIPEKNILGTLDMPEGEIERRLSSGDEEAA